MGGFIPMNYFYSKNKSNERNSFDNSFQSISNEKNSFDICSKNIDNEQNPFDNCSQDINKEQISIEFDNLTPTSNFNEYQESILNSKKFELASISEEVFLPPENCKYVSVSNNFKVDENSKDKWFTLIQTIIKKKN